MKLSDGITGGVYTVEAIELDEGIKRRLQILGMTLGSKVEIMNRKKTGTIIVKIRGTRYALGAKFARGIEAAGGESHGNE